MSESNDEFLAHYGVKGMRWGHRKSDAGGTRVPSEDHLKAQALKTKKLPELSNNELKTLTNRQNLEQQYQRLNPGTIKKGQLQVAALIGAPATAVGIYNLVKSPAGQDAIKVGKKFIRGSAEAIYKYRNAVGITKSITG